MKVLSLLQPWATLVVMGIKQIETRSWSTAHRGTLLIHASKGRAGEIFVHGQPFKKHIPDFTITYKPDFRQAIADSWPQSIDDSVARNDWEWKEEYNLSTMVKEMLNNI